MASHAKNNFRAVTCNSPKW